MKTVCALFASFTLLLCCTSPKGTDKTTFTDPSNTLRVTFALSKDSSPTFQVFRHNKKVLDTSALGLVREDGNFHNGLDILGIDGPLPITDSYTMYQGKRKKIRYTANRYTVHLRNSKDIPMDIIFQISYDGVAFRYYFPEKSQKIHTVKDEKTAYRFGSGTKAWLQPMSKAKTGWESTNPSYEENYLTDITVATPSPLGEGWVYPALFKVDDSWVLISETDLGADYCGSRLIYREDHQDLKVSFPQKEEIFPNGKLRPNATLPWYSPWRFMAIGSLNTITESTLGTDLAAPAIAMDTTFIQPGSAAWSWALLKDNSVNFDTQKTFIDYASAMNWPYCLIDVNWHENIGDKKIRELVAYAATKKVKLLLWYNSAGPWNSTPYGPKGKLLTHDMRMTEFKKLKEWGIAGVKVDFFGGDGQSMISYYHDIMKDAAANGLLVNFHGATLPRGWQRTYPNLMTVEAIKGQEFITFSQETADMQPQHCTVIPFTRNVFDPMDFTPMVLDSIPNIVRRTTPAFELALPVLFLSGIQHFAETPYGMEKMPQFVVTYLKEIPSLWTDSKFMAGYPGKDIIMARQKDSTWYVAGINGEGKEKEFTVDLSFVGPKKGMLITDGKDGHLEYKGIDLEKTPVQVLKMKPFGGAVLKF